MTLPDPPRVISLDPKTYGETLGDVRTIAQATGTKDAALDLIARTARRADIIRLAVRDVDRARAWPRSSGWIPCSSRATGRRSSSRWRAGSTCSARRASPPSARRGRSSRASEPEVVVVMPCGYDAARGLVEAEEHADAAARARRAAASWRSTPRRTSRGRARGSSTASSCWRTSCTPTACRARRPRRWRSSSDRRPHRPVPALVGGALRRRPPARAARRRPGPGALPPARRARDGRRAARGPAGRRASRCSCARWPCCAARRCRPRGLGGDRRGAGPRRRRPRAARPPARRRAHAHEHVGDARRQRGVAAGPESRTSGTCARSSPASSASGPPTGGCC